MLWDDFLNSDYHDWRGGGRSEDRLDKPGWLAQQLAGYGLTDPGPLSGEQLQALKRLRESMLRIVEAFAAGESAEPADLETLNRFLEAGPIVRRVAAQESGYSLEAVPLLQDWTGIAAEIAASFGRLLAEGESDRLRICDNPDCRWVYYDETRNRSKRYCDDKMCGNLMKVRRFRARKKTSDTK
ncbi:CGNR zinc finger domain-containing protein [Cohnella candidum]|uniref:Zinc finger CGNR domain-containing protein n=1 Tax=Cohnella candidum TaxID=2674991 RepID=A0A3G3K0M6_9BACL|nr:ABATE domain-containing protein [Cohnella candidum]AYQ73667.1 hypothetical protein EAV92_14410 [Cohnella candidum]